MNASYAVDVKEETSVGGRLKSNGLAHQDATPADRHRRGPKENTFAEETAKSINRVFIEQKGKEAKQVNLAYCKSFLLQLCSWSR